MENATPTTIADLYGSMVFDDRSMRERLPDTVFQSLQDTRRLGLPLAPDVANVVATAMKDWALEKGATHFSHWFHPMTNLTAEKHEAFISRIEDGRAVMEFSGKELMQGEPDASSLPSGGMRSTFEARGYTAWDPTSFAFIKDHTLCIPSAFCAYGGQSLDMKTPLLRSLEALNTQALRILRLFGNTSSTRVTVQIGAEQEYFLIDSEQYRKRKDLCLTGRTLYGAPTPKNQETAAHSYGAIRPRVAAFMRDLDAELWKMGIAARTEHNETAPAQHELAPIYTDANTATDHNQIMMEFMRKVAERHGLTCLLHEKPFAGLNGSGKHNNWSLATDDGQNLLEPGGSPAENAQFLLFLCAVVKAVDDYAPLLRIAVATAGNDYRLGGYEAPPAILSVYLGEELSGVLASIADGRPREEKRGGYLEIGVSTLPKLPRDTTDRNRTSPFAFTGNKFEFRMTGSSASVAGVNFILNAIVADTLCAFADELERTAGAAEATGAAGVADTARVAQATEAAGVAAGAPFQQALQKLIARTVSGHSRILFNGNNYAEAWIEEAGRRGLPHYPSAVDALPHLLDPPFVDVLTRQGIFTVEELRYRLENLLENYAQTISVEALTMLDIGRQEILPAVLAFSKMVSESLRSKQSTGLSLDTSYDADLLQDLSRETGLLHAALDELEAAQQAAAAMADPLAQATAWRETVLPVMARVREPADRLETMTGKTYWPFPSYTEILFSV